MDKLKKYLNEKNLPCDDEIINKYKIYMEGILEANKNINMTSITDPDEFIEKHYIDSILTSNFNEYKKAEKLIDIGTGGGFPGVPLAIISPEKKFVLLDSLKKRLKIIDNLLLEAGINNCQTVHDRAELAARGEHREKYDLVIARAVANMSTLLEYSLPFIRPGGSLLAYKGPSAEKETEEAQRAIKLLGGRFERIENVKYGDFNHNIVVIKKINNISKKYPRRPGTPAKEPL